MNELWGFTLRVLGESAEILADASPYLLFGFLAAGLLHGVISSETVARHLGRGRLGPVVKAALFGVPLPLCSCGVLPAALGLRKQGASKGATVSFLVSTPETGVDSIALTYALMDPVMTVFRPLAAFVTAVLAGTVENLFGRREADRAPAVPACGCVAPAASPRAPWHVRVRQGLRYAFVDLLGDLAPWLGIGFLLAGGISAALPEHLVGEYLGEGLTPMLVMLAVGVPLYLCATASTPIAAALMLKGLSPGAALVFLLAGPATNLASLTALSATLGVGTTARYLASICVGALAMGLALDAVYPALMPTTAVLGAAAVEVFPPALGWFAAAILVGLAVWTRLPWGRRAAGCACPGTT